MSSSTVSSTASSRTNVLNRSRGDSDIAISVQDLAKSYTIVHEERQTTLVRTAMARAKNPLQRPEKETFWALNGVSFDVKRGEVVGIIGRNGAGKSTLLKVLSRITEPTRGRAILHGRVGSLLEVGTGFHPELTGRENVYLNGAILGMTRREINRQFDAIVDFSGTEKFLDTPVKRYSSGMYVRLAFAVAAHLNPEILIVDEVLAVGDAEFQKKCLGTMEDVARSGRTVLLVSHNMATMNALCQSCIYLQSGEIRSSGSVSAVMRQYSDDLLQIKDVKLADLRWSGTGRDIRFTKASMASDDSYQVGFGETLSFILEIESDIDLSGLTISCSIFNHLGICVGTSFSDEHFNMSQHQVSSFQLDITDCNFAPGSYYAKLSVGRGGKSSTRHDYDLITGSPAFEVMPMSSSGRYVADWHPHWGSVFLNSYVKPLY